MRRSRYFRDAKGIRVTTAPALQVVSMTAEPSQPDLLRIRELIYSVAGIFHPDNKLRLLQDRCGRRMKELRVQTLREYFEHLTIRPLRQNELIALLNEITIGETCFFRNQPQLDALCRIVVPNILEAKARGNFPQRRLRIWSAGCSTGEEPYTLRMSLLDQADSQLKNWIIEILATDLNERSLVHAESRTVRTDSTRRRHAHPPAEVFSSMRRSMRVSPMVRANVSFSRLNCRTILAWTL